MVKLLSFLDNPKIQRNLLLVSLVIMIILFTRSCNPITGSENTYNQNLAALTDSIRVYQAKNGQLVYEKAAFISENGSLKNLNSELADEVKYLKDNPIVVIKTRTKIEHDTVEIPIYPTRPGTWNSGLLTQNFNWNLSRNHGGGNYRKLEGNFDVRVDTSYVISTSALRLTTDELGIAFTTGLTENKQGLLEIFVKSDYPGFRPTSLDGALIDPTKSDVLKKYFPPKRWGLGVYGGYGAYFDPISMRVGTGIQLGVGLQYNILQWNFKK
jgi:hypothetical protein